MQQLLAHLQGKMSNASALAQALGGALHTTAARYLDALVDTLTVSPAAAAPGEPG